MISGDDIEAMKPNKYVFDTVVDRAERGKSSDRLFNANEYLPVLRYAKFCERVMFALAHEVTDAQRRSIEAMSTYDKKGNPTNQQR